MATGFKRLKTFEVLVFRSISNWGQPFLGKEQLEYAALDVKVVRDLFYIFLKRPVSYTHLTLPTIRLV